jgi:hypothetical protein
MEILRGVVADDASKRCAPTHGSRSSYAGSAETLPRL